MAQREQRERRGRREEKEFDQRVVEVSRVTRVTKGGKRMRFRALVVVGDRKGGVAFSVGKAGDVAHAVNKAVRRASRRFFKVPLRDDTIPHRVHAKFAAAIIMLKPAPRGTGIKAGGATRIVLELAGIPNVVSKSLGSKNKINTVKATLQALQLLRLPPQR